MNRRDFLKASALTAVIAPAAITAAMSQPRFAMGGFVKSGNFGVLGDSCTEAIIPLRRDVYGRMGLAMNAISAAEVRALEERHFVSGEIVTRFSVPADVLDQMHEHDLFDLPEGSAA